MDRFTAYLLVRRHLKLAANRNRALAAEALMEELAQHAGQDVEQWGILGLLSQLDLEYAAANPDVRGVAAREQAELEGLDAQLGHVLAQWPQTAPSSPVEAALLLADRIAATALANGVEDRTALDRELEQGDDRIDQALAQLGLEPQQLVQLSLSALRRLAGELR